MLKIKNILVAALFSFVAISCGEFQTVLNKGTVAEQYKMAQELYSEQEYNKALQLFEKIIPAYRGKPQEERIQFMISESYYNTKSYELSASYFDRFTKNFPKSSKVEESKFLVAKSFYMDSDRYSLDQQLTVEAIDAFQFFINTYPDSPRIAEANELINELQYKLETKAFEISWQYYHMEQYQAAITSFDTFLEDYLGTSYKEEAMYYTFLSSYQLGMNSVFEKKELRLRSAVKSYERFLKYYPESTHLEEMTKLYEKLEEEAGFTI